MMSARVLIADDHAVVRAGLVTAVGGTLLLTPGFVTDIVGLLLLIPPTRAVLRRLLLSFFGRRFVVVDVGSRAARQASRRRYDFDGSAEEVDPRSGRPSGSGNDPQLPQ